MASRPCRALATAFTCVLALLAGPLTAEELSSSESMAARTAVLSTALAHLPAGPVCVSLDRRVVPASPSLDPRDVRTVAEDLAKAQDDPPLELLRRLKHAHVKSSPQCLQPSALSGQHYVTIGPLRLVTKRLAQVVLSVGDWEGFPDVFVCSVVINAGQWRQERPCEFSWSS